MLEGQEFETPGILTTPGPPGGDQPQKYRRHDSGLWAGLAELQAR